MEFKKLSEVDLVKTTSENTNVLIEDNGEVKKVAMDQIKVPQKPQVQADWNATDESSPAFILNKPEKLGGGGYTYFAISNDGGIWKTDGVSYPSSGHVMGSDVTRAEFEEAYKTSPIMLVPPNDHLDTINDANSPCPCVWYYLNVGGYPNITYVNYDGYSLRTRSINFSDGYTFK